MDQLTDVFTAISHPTRRSIIGRLAAGPARFTDIAEPFDTALNSVTKHLKLLERPNFPELEFRFPARPESHRQYPNWKGAIIAKVIFGNHSSAIVPLRDRDGIRKFYCDILGGTITKEESDRDFIRLGDNFYIVFLYGDVPDESEFLRTARSVWLEIKSDNVEEM